MEINSMNIFFLIGLAETSVKVSTLLIRVDRTSPQHRIKEYLLFALFFDTLVFDSHHATKN